MEQETSWEYKSMNFTARKESGEMNLESLSARLRAESMEHWEIVALSWPTLLSPSVKVTLKRALNSEGEILARLRKNRNPDGAYGHRAL